jgi:hypothetical protein
VVIPRPAPVLAKITSPAAALAFACWSTKPMFIDEMWLTRVWYSYSVGLDCAAESKTRRGMPICPNIRRGVWNWTRPLKAGDAICLPSRLLLPSSQVRTSLRM